VATSVPVAAATTSPTVVTHVEAACSSFSRRPVLPEPTVAEIRSALQARLPDLASIDIDAALVDLESGDRTSPVMSNEGEPQ
jgi:hypothetical protein